LSRPICRATRQDGQPCRGSALPGGELCWVHDPDRAEQAAEARRAGAVKTNKLRALKGRRARLDTAGSLMRFVATLAHRTLEGELAPDIARSVGYLCSLQIRLVETAAIERRLAAIETRLAAAVTRRVG
jgi:hypothetical protein